MTEPATTASTAPSRTSPSRLRWALLVGSVLLQSVASAFSKQAGLSSAQADSLVWVVINPWYGASLVAMGLQAVFWVLTLRAFRLSVAYPLTSVVFVLHVFWAWMIFDEAIGAGNVLGLCLIVAGVALVGRETSEDALKVEP